MLNSSQSAISKEEKPFPRGLFITTLLVIVLWGMSAARAFLVPVCLAAMIAFLAAPLVRLLNRLKFPDWLAIAISALVLSLPFAFGGFLLFRQAQELLQDFPSIVAALNRALTNLSNGPLGKHLGLSEFLSVSALTEKLAQSAGQGIQLLLGGLRALLDTSSQAILITLFAILMLGTRDHLRRSAERILARFENIEAARMLEAVTTLIERFLIARLVIVAIIAVAAMIGLRVLGLRYSFLLGLLTGVMTLVPAVGFAVALVATLLTALATGHSLLSIASMGGLLLFLNIIESNALSPKLVGKSLNVNALFTFLGFFAGGLIWGIWGMLLAVPILGVIRIALSVSPALKPWGELLAEREDKTLVKSLVRHRHSPATSAV